MPNNIFMYVPHTLKRPFLSWGLILTNIEWYFLYQRMITKHTCWAGTCLKPVNKIPYIYLNGLYIETDFDNCLSCVFGTTLLKAFLAFVSCVNALLKNSDFGIHERYTKLGQKQFLVFLGKRKRSICHYYMFIWFFLCHPMLDYW